MNKAALVKKIIAGLTKKMELHVGAARSAHAEATHEQSKADDKYDTRGLEASYLARGQAMQFAETEQALASFHTMTVRTFPPDEPADLGALVEVEGADGRTVYFIGPGAGGMEVSHEKRTVLVITPTSPIGRQLVGRRRGDRVPWKIGKMPADLRVISVA